MRLSKTLLLVSLMSAFILSSCGFPGDGVTPDTSLVLNDGSPVVKPTHTPTSSPISSYAFVRQDQLWVSFNGRNPIQVTHLNYSSLGSVPNIFWGQPLWSPGDGFIAFILRAFSGYFDDIGTCHPPGIDRANPGALYVLNTRTLQLTRVVLSSVSGYPADNNPLTGFWQYFFWEDATHVLASSLPDLAGTNGSLFRYDLTTKTLSEVIPSSSLKPIESGVSIGSSIWFPLRYSSGQLFYQVIEADPQHSKNITFVIYSHSTLHPELPNTKVLDMGSEPVSNVGQNIFPPCPPITNPGWDISPDGKHLVAQMLLTDNTGHLSSSIRVLNLADGSMEALFGQVSSKVLTGELTLTWGPDNQSVLLSSWLSRVGPYSATLLHPEQSQAYPPDTTGHVVWRSDSAVFALFQFQWIGMGPNSEATVYMFAQGKPDRRLFLSNAQNFAWG
jgi:hypothetical protein